MVIAGLLGALNVQAATTPKPAKPPKTSTDDSMTFKDIEQGVKTAEDKVVLLKADDYKVAVADKMKDEDRDAAIKAINEAIQGAEKSVGSAETSKTLTASHAKQLKRRIQEIKTFLTAYNKKHEAKPDEAKKVSPETK